MTNTHPALRSPSLALIIGASILVSACGGGSSTPAAAPSPGVNPPADSRVTSPSTVTPPINANGFIGSCPSLTGGSATPSGYEIGFCNTYFASGASLVAEGTFQNQNVSTPEIPAANQYSLNLPNTAANPWGGTISLAAGATNVTQTPSTIGNLAGGYGLDRFVTAVVAPAADNTSLVDFSSNLGSPRYATFGLWGRSKLQNENFYGAFFGPAFGQSATPSTFLNGASTNVTLNGPAVSWYLYSASSAVPAGVTSRIGLSATAQMQVNFSSTSNNVIGTINNFFDRSSGSPVNLGLTPVTFTATLVKADGTFSGTITGGGTGIIKGSLFGPTAQQAAGQFVLTATGSRMLSGSFGVKQP